jgi:hypothetical protein
MTRFRLSVAALLCLISTSAWADLRTYDVDFQYRNEVYEALRNLLTVYPGQVNTGSYGIVQLLPSGQILVNATPETLEQVDQLLRAIRARPAAATPRVTLRYWAVLGTPSDLTANSPANRALPPVLNEVLAEVRRFHGNLAFRVLGTAAVVSESGQSGEVHGGGLIVNQTAHVQGDTLNADIEITLHYDPEGIASGVDVQTSLGRGEFVVLGENTQWAGDIQGTLFYIVHWPE